MAELTIYVTAKDGSIATVTGQRSVIDAIIGALVEAGAAYRETEETYDFGFYQDAA